MNLYFAHINRTVNYVLYFLTCNCYSLVTKIILAPQLNIKITFF